MEVQTQRDSGVNAPSGRGVRRWLTVITLLAVVLVAAACGGSDESSKQTDGGTTGGSDKVDIALVMPALDNEAWKADAKFMEDAAAADGNANFEVYAGKSAADLPSQLNALQTAILKQPDALILTPQDPKALSRPLQAAMERYPDMKVILFANEVPGVSPASAILFPDFRGGEVAGKYFAENVPRGSTIGLLGCAPGTYPNTKARMDGARSLWDDMNYQVAMLADACPGGAVDGANGRRVMADMLTAHPDVEAVFSVSDVLTLGALSAIKQAKKDIFVASYDAQPPALEAVQAGTLDGTVDIQIPKGAKAAFDTAVAAARGETVPATVNIPSLIIDESNVDDALAANGS